MAREKFQTLSEPMYYILLAMWEEVCGVDIMNKVAELSQGRVKVGPGTVYAMLERFEENGFIVRTRSQARKKWYVITEAGKARLKEEQKRLLQQYKDGEHLLGE